jgi:phage tail-like protein
MFRTARITLLVTLATATTVLAGSPTAGASAPPYDAITASQFSITVDGYNLGAWSKVEGLTVTFDSQRKVVLTRGTPTTPHRNLEIFAWHEAVVVGQLRSAKDAVITVYGANGQPVARYHLENAWPSKVKLGLKSRVSEASHETVTLVCDELHRVSP